jgi:hypothetical protein
MFIYYQNIKDISNVDNASKITLLDDPEQAEHVDPFHLYVPPVFVKQLAAVKVEVSAASAQTLLFHEQI